jgi:hypothetical protein
VQRSTEKETHRSPVSLSSGGRLRVFELDRTSRSLFPAKRPRARAPPWDCESSTLTSSAVRPFFPRQQTRTGPLIAAPHLLPTPASSTVPVSWPRRSRKEEEEWGMGRASAGGETFIVEGAQVIRGALKLSPIYDNRLPPPPRSLTHSLIKKICTSWARIRLRPLTQPPTTARKPPSTPPTRGTVP